MKKVSTSKRIIAFARTKPDGFKAADVHHLAKGKSKSNIYVALTELKKRGVLVHDASTGVYKFGEVNSKTVRVSAPPKPKQDAETDHYRRLFDSLAEMHEKLEQRHEDALAIIRYLENKLYIAIQRDVDHNRGVDAGG